MIIDGKTAPVARRKFPWIQLDNVVDLFLDLGNLQTDVLSDYTNLHSQVMWVSLSPYPHRQLLSFVFLMTAILSDLRYDINEISIFISLMADNVEKCF